jgi:microcystin-dependent protein
MANLTETVQWESGVYQWETTDPAQGGANGIMNTPTRQLANRTAWLRSKLGGFGEMATISINENPFNISANDLNKLIVFNNSDNSDVTLNLPNGAAGNKVALYYNSSEVAGIRVTVDGVSLVEGDYIEFVYIGTSMRIMTAYSGLGVGSVEAFARNTPPSGYLACNGAAISRTTYARLFARIGTTFGTGNGTTTFNLPDLRGEFIRGWDNARGIDTGRVFGSAQGQEIQSHTHTEQNTSGSLAVQAGASGTVLTTQNTTNTGATGGTETRPRNIALLYCIKF